MIINNKQKNIKSHQYKEIMKIEVKKNIKEKIYH